MDKMQLMNISAGRDVHGADNTMIVQHRIQSPLCIVTIC
jgi:hypothetical protein